MLRGVEQDFDFVAFATILMLRQEIRQGFEVRVHTFSSVSLPCFRFAEETPTLTSCRVNTQRNPTRRQTVPPFVTKTEDLAHEEVR